MLLKKSCHFWVIVGRYDRALQATDDNIIQMCLACCITKATDTHSEYVILTAFPLQQLLCKHAAVLCL